MRRRKAGAGSMATTSCPRLFKVSGSPTGSKSPPTPRPRNPKPPPPDPSGHHQDSAIAPDAVVAAEGNKGGSDSARILPLRVVWDPGMHIRLLHGNRES